MAKPKQSAALFDQLDKAIQGGEGDEVVGKMKVCTDTLPRLGVALLMFDLDCNTYNKALCWKGCTFTCACTRLLRSTPPPGRSCTINVHLVGSIGHLL